MKGIWEYLLKVILPIVVLTIFGTAYKSIVCFYSEESSDLSLICNLNWKDGFILLVSYFVVKIISSIFGWKGIGNTILFSIVVYSVFYALYAFPYWFSSFFQSFSTNTFIHTIILILLVEIVFSRISKKT